MAKFREAQRKIIEEYNGGLMGIAAVPGSGKTFTLSHLAARLVQQLAQEYVPYEREVLIVTFANAAVNGFKSKIAEILQTKANLLPYVGYRVRTLHGLAHDIVRERPGLVGLAEDFQIIDERIASAVVRDIVYSHLPAWSSLMDTYLSANLQHAQRQKAERRDFPEYMVEICERFIKQAKDNLIQPIDLQEKFEELGREYDLARFASDVYTDYQRSLAFRGAVDFDDLVRLAIEGLQLDPQFLARLQERWPYILEDEAQDSSRLQEDMLRLLTGNKNWVRVGDPNQAINTTFTTASPRFLVEFLENETVLSRPLPNSGRSGKKIIGMANELVKWTIKKHPASELQGFTTFYNQKIEPTKKGDPQPNPSDQEIFIHIDYQPGMNITPENEIKRVVTSLKKWLTENGDKTVAVLVPENSRGFKLAEELRREGLDYEELLRSTTEARTAASYLRSVLLYLATPNDAGILARLYRDVWWPLTLKGDEEHDLAIPFQALSRQRYLENLIWPVEEISIQEMLGLPDDPVLIRNVGDFLYFVRRWLEALELPIDQLVLTISQDIFNRPPDIALAYKIAVLLRSMAQNNPTWRLKDFAEELRSITDNQRKFLGFDDAGEGFEPTPGKITVATMHAAKGLEWDRVYLMAVSNYAFPSLQPEDSYIGERWFIRDKLNLEAELMAMAFGASRLPEGQATLNFRVDYVAERLRLLYVAITRAKRELVITWNMGRFWEQGIINHLANPILHLEGFLNGSK